MTCKNLLEKDKNKEEMGRTQFTHYFFKTHVNTGSISQLSFHH